LIGQSHWRDSGSQRCYGAIMMTTTKTPSGYYQDPLDWRIMRYWDGTAWTPHMIESKAYRQRLAVPRVAQKAQARKGTVRWGWLIFHLGMWAFCIATLGLGLLVYIPVCYAMSLQHVDMRITR
jgi:Protein of unknown function (DUF2510)